MLCYDRLNWNVYSPNVVRALLWHINNEGQKEIKLNSQQSTLYVENADRDSVYILLFSHTYIIQ
jgi:hypothetical protein